MTPGNDPSDPLVHQKIADQQPTEFMGELKGLNQALFLKFTQRPTQAQIDRPLQRGQGALEILQPLNPANVRRGHPAMLAPWTTGIN